MPWLLIIIGLIFFLKNLNFLPWLDWSFVWPVILILGGLYLMKKKGGDGCCGWSGDKKEENKK